MDGYQAVEDSVDYFRCTGFLVVPGVLARRSLSILLTKVRSLLPVGDRAAERIEDVAARLDLVDVLQSSGLPERWIALLGGNVVAIRNRHNHLTIDRQRGLKSAALHRDSLNWTRSYVTTMVLMAGEHQDAWPRVIPGSHLWTPAGPPNGGGYWLTDDRRRDLARQAVIVPMRPGDAILMDPLLFHAAGRGSREDPRIALTLAVRAVDELAEGLPRHEQLLLGTQIYEGQAWFPAEHENVRRDPQID
ncbi:phytanoyl-CoA dioxygenase family protein [Kribbella sp. C-35]|uniref:phytanoyl-CoA dioxygenase family protein n=1 Tax=Kribbella sp. C-35 TaxID=2789276 RepID=UPI00397BA698